MIDLTDQPLDLASMTSHLHDSAAGGVCVFIGVTRAEKSDGRELLALDYSAYEEMARKQLADLAERAKAKWPIQKLVLVHRLGRVDVGEASVVIGVATPHRPESFEACRWLIDTLKSELAVWKKDLWQGGDTSWTKPNQESFTTLDGQDT